MYAVLAGATHNSFSGNFNGSRGYITAWFKAHLAGDCNARALFYGAGCVMCSDPTYETK